MVLSTFPILKEALQPSMSNKMEIDVHLGMSQLSRTRSHKEDDNLCNTIPHGSRSGRFRRVPIISLPLARILLLPPDLLELDVEVTDIACEAADVRPAMLNVVLGGADDDVEVEADVSMGEPGGVVSGEADGVVAGVL
ncbi:hypothetical protein H0H87_003739 [Tephrocybe sp. NHM501043]|nr:hypothetical protein H0H87_003739 [Tephrocybe sp. NHM501043]